MDWFDSSHSVAKLLKENSQFYLIVGILIGLYLYKGMAIVDIIWTCKRERRRYRKGNAMQTGIYNGQHMKNIKRAF